MEAILTRIGFLRRFHPVLQSEPADCGLACLAAITSHLGHEISLRELKSRFPISLKGMTLETVLQVAAQMGLASRPLRAEIEHLPDIPVPALLHWNLSHFVVLVRRPTASSRHYHIMDPAIGLVAVPESEFNRSFTGVAVEFRPAPDFMRRKSTDRPRLRDLWSSVRGTLPTLAPPIGLSVMLQIATLISPLFVQYAVDTILPTNNGSTLIAFAAGFVGLVLLALAFAVVRGILIAEIGNLASFQISTGLVRHILSLPLAWIEKRQTADMLSRVDSIAPATDILSRAVVINIIDGLLAVLTLVMMLIYNPLLALVPISFAVIFGGFRLGFQPWMNRLNMNNIIKRAGEQGMMMENLQNAASIKAYGREHDRYLLWLDRKISSVNAAIRLSIAENSWTIAETYVALLENIVFFALAILLVMKGNLTLGQIFAFAAYKQFFVTAVTQATRALAETRLLNVHLERISDIVAAEPEQTGPPRTVFLSDASAAPPDYMIEVKGVSFSYGFGETEVLQNVDLTIRPGETVALAGRSGGGKTTLMRIMLGLLKPTNGEVLIDGVPLHRFGVDRWRSTVGYVAQDDDLFAGSILENITFFDANPSFERAVESARMASVSEDINAMPMAYETLCGDMGSTLSGGQKARILLARALYKRPMVLFIDEGTAHLDVETERAVNEAIRAIGVSRLLIAHRPDTLRLADRIIRIERGRVTT